MTLMVGTSLAQALPIAAAPILSRLFTPHDFGVFALFTAITSVISIVASGRYELAILLPSDDNDALYIVILSIILTSISSFVLLILIIFFNQWITNILGNSDIAPWLYFVPLAIFFTGVYQALNYWFNRKQQYKQLATNRVVKSGITIIISLALGTLNSINGGLIWGMIGGQGIATINFVRRARIENHYPLTNISKTKLLNVAKRYQNFPKFSVPADTVNAISAQMPVFLLTAFFGPVVVGYLSLTQRMLGAPISIVSAAFADVFKQKASRDFNTFGNCRAIWISTFIQLMLLSVLPFAILTFVAPNFFAFVFGEPWREAGKYAQMLAPYYFLAFTVSPLSRTLYVAEKQKYDLLWQLGLIVFTTIGLLIGCWMGQAQLSIILFTVAYSSMYLIYLWMSFKFSAGK